MAPLIGITCDTNCREEPSGRMRTRYESPIEYARAVAGVGGTPVLLPHEPACLDHTLRACDGFVLTGGDDPDTTSFGEAVHPEAKLISPQRQAFELELLRRLEQSRQPVLGICLGMQLMALSAGGRLDQHLPDVPGVSAEQARLHADGDHEITVPAPGHPLLPDRGVVHSRHHQAIADAGRMRVLARSGDGLIEAIDRPDTPGFYLGVQWHPERTEDRTLGRNLFVGLLDACRNRSS
ncbi:MAG: gamma-glutamyl-gamma-aminobutyrate hydrolase family protein [Phycisphaerae bacterium]|nr:gamma-glutamyl-gamma-aminobutyrate hydrolase family protein [Phycisphaerae bacterium]